MKLLYASVLVLQLLEATTAFSFGKHPHTFLPTRSSVSPQPSSATTLFAAKKKVKAASAALEALEKLEQSALLDEPLSKKELKELEKQKKKQAKQQQATATAVNGESKESSEPAATQQPAGVASSAPTKPLTKAEKLMLLEEQAAEMEATLEQSDEPVLSKKELNELKKKQEKEALKAEKRAAKKAQKKPSEDDDMTELPQVNGHVNGQSEVVADATPDMVDDPDLEYSDEDMSGEGEPQDTLEDKVRRERPPPRIRVMESSQPGYTSLRLENVGIMFRNQAVLKDVTWGVQTGDRIGLVGANGAGKTTQLRILAGELEPTTGDVVKSSKDLRVAMLRQEFVDELVPTRTLREELLSVFEEENKILQELKDCEAELGNSPPEDVERMQQLLDRMQELQNLAENKEAYALESRIKKVMDVMGFNEDEGDDLIASFSGGWKMRIGLGKVLLKDPNVLLLDEPTNHLDLDSVEWLEAFLREQNIPMVIVSHDREFLDQVCTKIVDAEGGICTEYDGNYSRFLLLKKARLDAWNAAYAAQEKKLKEEKDWINRFKTKQPQAVKQRIAKMEKFMASDEYIQKPPSNGKPFRFRFPDAPRLSPEVAEVKDLSHGYRNELTQNRLFENANLMIEKGDRIAVVGPNGAGKSTLLRLLVGKETPDAGEANIVGQNVVMNYFEQNQADALDLDKTVLETIQAASNGQSYNELRALLGQFLFKGDAVEKKVRSLSGGEKARLSLCCMMLRPANFLVLDEPTNHLDIPAKQMLEEALQNFAGSIMVVSHDRYFISRCANTIIAIEDRDLVKYQGDYKFYMDRSSKLKEKIESRYVKGTDRIEAAPVVDLEVLETPDKKRNFGGAKTAHLVTRKDKGVKNAKRLQKR